ncbi:hypothetical protein P7D22_21610 [Lichenihabitans sp. Uapishka_5]|uniref:hypothetical protein n=1 Tax=Lichenihabitans sp. Uapishka_5 TaxID=3037302 RepID=UPI0029E82179|nr:hypothetical protein [Lichenihabitans sp. Uapishka_5]MDX7953765.1 hypothetical protein [Lichenihabitans sp. Uapishka_5]
MKPKKSVSLAGRPRDGQDATPERLRHAAARSTVGLDPQGVRRIGDAFDLLHARNLLDRENPATNALLWQAGDRLRGHWYLTRLDPLAAFDFRRESVDGGGAPSPGPSHAALRHRESLRDAEAAVGARLLPYLTGLVIDGRTVAELRPLVADTGHARTADALVIERLREALHRLCEHWSMGRPAGRPGRVRGWRAPDAAALA